MNQKQILLHEKYNSKKNISYFLDLLLIKSGYPLAYIIGDQPFLNLNLNLKYKPLIPRPETEFWIKEYVFPCVKPKLKILDIFSGSGCMGLAIAKNFPNTKVMLSDISPKYIKQINLNAELNNVKNISVIQSDMFENISGKYDIIVANPPYISKHSHDTKIDTNVFLFENKKSLFANNHGLYYIQKLIKESYKHLNKRGILFFEFDPWQKDKIIKIINNDLKIKEFKFKKDQYNKNRICKITF